MQRNRTKSRSVTFYQVTVFLILLFSCAWTEAKTPAKGQSTPAANSEDSKSQTQYKTLDKDSYSNYFLASLNIYHGDYKKAKKYLQKVYDKDPGSAYLNKKMAILFEKIGDLKSAVKYAQECVKIDSKDINSHLLLAELSAMNSDRKTEQAEYETILSLDPSQQRVRFLLATSLIRSDRLDEAMKQLDYLLAESPELSFAHYYRARIYLEWGKYEAAEEEYITTLDLDNTFEPALFDLASLYQSQNRLNDSIQLYKKLADLYPNNRTAQERLMGLYKTTGQTENIKELIGNIESQSKPGDPGRQILGIYYLQNGRFADAISEFDLIVTAWPDDDKSRYFLSLAYEETDMLDKALEHLRLIKPASEYFVYSQIHIAYILSDMEKSDEGIKLLQNAIKAKADGIPLYLTLSSLYEEKGDYQKALEIIQAGLKYDQKDIDLLFRLGVELDKLGDRAACISQMKKVLEIDPNHVDSLNYIGYSYAEQGINLDEAMDLIQRALKMEPESGFIIDSLGWVYFQKGLYDEALISLEKAFALKPSDPTIAEHLGDVYLKKNEYQRSLEMYQKALSLKHNESDKIMEKIKEVQKFLE